MRFSNRFQWSPFTLSIGLFLVSQNIWASQTQFELDPVSVRPNVSAEFRRGAFLDRPEENLEMQLGLQQNLSDRLVTAIELPVTLKRSNPNGEQTAGLSETKISLGYRFLEEFDWSLENPSVFFYLSASVPLDRETYRVQALSQQHDIDRSRYTLEAAVDVEKEFSLFKLGAGVSIFHYFASDYIDAPTQVEFHHDSSTSLKNRFIVTYIGNNQPFEIGFLLQNSLRSNRSLQSPNENRTIELRPLWRYQLHSKYNFREDSFFGVTYAIEDQLRELIFSLTYPL